MVSTAKKILIFLLIFSLWSIAHSSLHAASKSNFVSRQWVVKLKQNSWMNRRPFQFATPVVDEGRVFVGVQKGFFYAIDAKRGKKIWTFKTQGPVHAAARVNGPSVYFADTKGNIYSLSKENGSLLWVSKVDGEIMSAPLILENKIYVVTLSKELFAFDLTKGTLLWQTHQTKRDSGFTVRGSANPVFAGGNILVGYSDGSLIAHSLQNGQIKWAKQLGDRTEEFHDVDSTILIAGKLAYVSSADGKLYALDPYSGQTIWQAPVGGVNDAVLQDPFLYVTAGGVVYSLQVDTGQIVWEQNLEVPEISSPVVHDKWLTVVATKGKVYFLDRLTGDILHSWFVKGGSYSDPVVSGNQLFLLSNASRLYSFQFQ